MSTIPPAGASEGPQAKRVLGRAVQRLHRMVVVLAATVGLLVLANIVLVVVLLQRWDPRAYAASLSPAGQAGQATTTDYSPPSLESPMHAMDSSIGLSMGSSMGSCIVEHGPTSASVASGSTLATPPKSTVTPAATESRVSVLLHPSPFAEETRTRTARPSVPPDDEGDDEGNDDENEDDESDHDDKSLRRRPGRIPKKLDGLDQIDEFR